MPAASGDPEAAQHPGEAGGEGGEGDGAREEHEATRREAEADAGEAGGGPDGEAAETSAADYVYSGERDGAGLPHGFGRCVYSQTGLVYEGEFEHGSACGEGELTWPNGTVYSGVVVDGQPVEGRLDRANGETLYFEDGEVVDSEWYALEDREVTQEELDAAKQEAEAARLHALKARLVAEEMQANIELQEAEQEVQNLAREVKRARSRVQRERRLRVTAAAMRCLRLRVLCTKEEFAHPAPDAEESGEDEAGRGAADASRSESPASRPQTKSTATQGEAEADTEAAAAAAAAAAEAEARKLERKRAAITLEISVDEFHVDWRLDNLDFTWFQALDQNIRQAFKLPVPRYDSFGFSETEPEPPASPHTLAVRQRSKDLLAFKIGPDLLSDSESETDEEFQIMTLPRELPSTPHLALQGALQKYMDGLLLLAGSRARLADRLFVALKVFEMLPDPTSVNEVMDEHHAQQAKQLKAMKHEIDQCLAILRGQNSGSGAGMVDLGAATEASIRLFALMSHGHVDAELAEMNRKAIVSHPALLAAIKGGFAFESAVITFNVCRFLLRAVQSEARRGGGGVGGGGGSTSKDIRLEILKYPGLLERLIKTATEEAGEKLGPGQGEEETLRACSQSLRLHSSQSSRTAPVVLGDSRTGSRLGTAATGTRSVRMGEEIESNLREGGGGNGAPSRPGTGSGDGYTPSVMNKEKAVDTGSPSSHMLGNESVSAERAKLEAYLVPLSMFVSERERMRAGEPHAVSRNANPAGAPLPASNTWACRGAPPAP